MARYRPTAVLVIAILNLVGGALGLLYGLYTFVVLLIGSTQMFAVPTVPPLGAPNQQVQEMQEFQKRIEHLGQNPPGGKALQYGATGVDLILSVMMLVSGIGLIGVQPWARRLAITYAVLSILLHLFQVVYAFGFMIPAFSAVFAEMPQGNQFLNMFASMMKPILIISAVIGFLFIIYPIVVLIFMFRSSNVAAFRGDYPDPDAWKNQGRMVPEVFDAAHGEQRLDDRFRVDKSAE